MKSMCARRVRTGRWNVSRTGRETFKKKSVRASDLIWPQRRLRPATRELPTILQGRQHGALEVVVAAVNLICQHVLEASDFRPH